MVQGTKRISTLARTIGMPLSNPFTSRKNKRSAVVYPQGFQNGSVVDLNWRPPNINGTTMSTQFDSATPHSTTTEPLKTVQRYLKGYQISSSSGSNGDNSLFPFTPVPKPSSSTRYYRHALSSEGKAALCRGELNHNLQVYSPDDIIKHHESRKSLVPQGVGANKLHKMEAFAKIEEDKQHSQRAFDEKVRGKAVLPRFRFTNS